LELSHCGEQQERIAICVELDVVAEGFDPRNLRRLDDDESITLTNGEPRNILGRRRGFLSASVERPHDIIVPPGYILFVVQVKPHAPQSRLHALWGDWLQYEIHRIQIEGRNRVPIVRSDEDDGGQVLRGNAS